MKFVKTLLRLAGRAPASHRRRKDRRFDFDKVSSARKERYDDLVARR
jgi:hypothetical protein